jgi:dCTP diphosphatase
MMADQETTVGDLRGAVKKFVSARNWEVFHNPKNLASSIAIEAAEIMEHFQWLTIEEGKALMKGDETRAEVADELADVMIYCLSFANASGIDVSEAILKKLARNEGRFPVDQEN